MNLIHESRANFLFFWHLYVLSLPTVQSFTLSNNVTIFGYNGSLLRSIGILKPTIGMITYRNTCALDCKGKIAYKLI